MRPRRFVAVLAGACLLAPTGLASSSSADATWAKREIKLVVSQGLMAPDVASFRPADPLMRGELADLVAGLTGTEQRAPARPATKVTVAELDRRLVAALGLQGAAATFTRAARSAGLQPPARFGTEVAARLLGLRTNHPAGQDELERHPQEPAPRAEAAYSAARILSLGSWELERVRESALALAVPELGEWERRILRTAVSLIGYAYVWGGESERLERGFDCSGFVWRVYKLQSYSGSAGLADTLRGRTTYAMSGEVPRAQRIGFEGLAPGDVVFFGAAGPRSKPAEVDHMGIYFGSGWLIHSSGHGVAFVPLEGWYRKRFAWARRPLAEAGLASAAAAENTVESP
ncbi:MAG: C40 family peptidase [Thermoleophilia bacterium]|nr:C40 family peptidase [Thermoleophilia bacterium]